MTKGKPPIRELSPSEIAFEISMVNSRRLMRKATKEFQQGKHAAAIQSLGLAENKINQAKLIVRSQATGRVE